MSTASPHVYMLLGCVSDAGECKQQHLVRLNPEQSTHFSFACGCGSPIEGNVKRADCYPVKQPSHVLQKATVLALGSEEDVMGVSAGGAMLVRHEGPFEKSRFFGGQ